jgi:hypothetical protein
MKRLITFLALVCLSSVAFGAEDSPLVPQVPQPEVESKQMWKISTKTTEASAKLKAQLVQSGWLVDDYISIDNIATMSFAKAASEGYLAYVPDSNRSKDSYKGMWKRWNSKAIAGRTKISWSEFLRITRGLGWWLPISEGSLAKVREAHAKLDELRIQSQAGDKDAAKRADALEAGLGGIGLSLSGLQTDFTKMENLVSGLEKRIVVVEKGLTEVSTQVSDNKGMIKGMLGTINEAGVKQSEKNSLMEKQQWGTIAAVIVIGIMLLLSHLSHRKSRLAVKKIVDRVAKLEPVSKPKIVEGSSGQKNDLNKDEQQEGNIFDVADHLRRKSGKV